MRFYRHDRKIAVNEVAIKPAGGKAGRFTLGFRAKTPGTITVRATHRATPRARDGRRAARERVGAAAARHAGRARARRPRAPAAALAPGLRRRAARPLRRPHRAGRHRVPQGHRDGAHARSRRPRCSAGSPRARVASTSATRSHGRHVEGDIGHQVLALINGSKVERIYPMSSGKPSTPTVIGNFRVYMREFGHERPRHGRLELLHPRLRDPRLRRRARVQREPRLPADPGARRGVRLRWVRLGTRVDTYR